MSGGRPPARDLEAFALKKKVLRLETLYDVSRSLNSAREEKALLEEILARAVPVLDAARGFAAAFEDAEGSGTVASLGRQPEPDPLAVASDPFVLDLARAKTSLSRGAETVLGRAAGSVAGVPLLSGGRVLGVLVVLDREARGGDASTFDDEDRRFLVSLAGLVGPALDAARRFRALATDLDRLREENRSLKGSLRVDEILVGDSPAMRRAKELVARAA
ncbi:MAG: GAF domain-containing protein, partial [Thermoanaerobaculia bacterium]